MFSHAVWSYSEVSGAEAFFCEWPQSNFAWKELLQAGANRGANSKELTPLAHQLSMLDPALLRAAFKTDFQRFSALVQEEEVQHSPHLSCCFVHADGNQCQNAATSRRNLARRAMSAHGQTHPIFRSIVCNQCPICLSIFASRMSARLHLG